MTISRVVVLSGFENRVLEKIEPILKSQQISSISNKKNESGEKYFQSKLNKLMEYLDTHSGKNLKHIVLLASCISKPDAINLEEKIFFPLVRRLGIPPQWRADINKRSHIAKDIIAKFTSNDLKVISHEFKKPINQIYLLPYNNCGIGMVKKELDKVYNLSANEFSSKIDKHITKIRGTGKLRINGLDFNGVINGDEHPVRRCTDTAWCDAAARLRLGFEVASRFEFDVSCENKLAGKTFYHCDLKAHKIPTGVDHLNMRINGDFKY